MLKTLPIFCIAIFLFSPLVTAEEVVKISVEEESSVSAILESVELNQESTIDESNASDEGVAIDEIDESESTTLNVVSIEPLSIEEIIEQQKLNQALKEKQELATKKAQERLNTIVQFCTPCHGKNGIPRYDIYPVLAGQKYQYLLKQLHDFKSNRRENVVMQGLVNRLTEEEMQVIAQYYANYDASGNFSEPKTEPKDQNNDENL